MEELKKKNPKMDGGSNVLVNKDLFSFLLRKAVSLSSFNERFYLDKYPDVRGAPTSVSGFRCC
ncbi:hypothetical protein [Methylocystis parvus]|uniref:hypothetical protein n=1 Tax=Methylocystis parvus TaxID=134 RepID=UPI003C76E468